MTRSSKLMYLLSGLSLICLIILRFIFGGWNYYLLVPMSLTFIFFIAPFFIDYKLFKELLSLKTTRSGLNMGTSILLVFILLGVINYIGVKKQMTFDFSLGKVNTLSDQSKNLLKSLTENLTVTYFYQKDQVEAEQNKKSFIELVKKYQDESSYLKLEFVDVNAKPALVKEYGVDKGSGVVFVSYKDQRQRIDVITEQELTNAVSKVIHSKKHNLYFLTGHGESELADNANPQGAGALKKWLEGKNFVVKTLNLTNEPKIPVDAEVVILLGPLQNLLDYEVKEIESYLARGGNLMAFMEAGFDAGLGDFYKKIGIENLNNYVLKVIETSSGKVVNPAATPIGRFSETHSITKIFKKDASNIITKMPTSFVKLANLPPTISIDEIAKTEDTDMGFSTTEFKNIKGKAPYTIGMTIKGKWSGDEKNKEFNVFVFGDAEFLNNQFFFQRLNRDLMFNSLAYLVKEEAMISIAPKEVLKTELNFDQEKFYLFIYIFIIPLPLILLVISGSLWFRRRHA